MSPERCRPFVTPQTRARWRNALVVAAPIVLCALTWALWLLCDVGFTGFETASFVPPLSSVRHTYPLYTAYYAELTVLATTGALLRKHPREQRILQRGAMAGVAFGAAIVIIAFVIPKARWSWRARHVERAIAAASKEHPWAGTYSGDLVGTLHLAPDGTFLAESHSCFGHSGSAYGEIAEHDGGLELHADRSPYWPPQRLSIVTWGPRHYLIGDEHWGTFCQWMREGWEQRESSGLLLLRDDDWKLPVTGMPKVPAHVERCFTGKTLPAHVIRAHEYGGYWVDGGVEHGFREDQPVEVESPRGTKLEGTLLRVDLRESWIRVDHVVDDPSILFGWKVTIVPKAPISSDP